MRALPAALALLVLLAPGALPLGGLALWPDGPGHDHGNPAHHAGVAQGMAQVAQLKIRDGSVGEVDVLGDLAVVAHFGSAGLSTVDVSDPADPRLLGQLNIGGAGGMDVKLLPGGQRALLATQGGTTCRLTFSPVSLPGATGCGVNLVDIADPAAPKLLANLPFGGRGVHMLDVATIHGQPFAFLVGQDPTYQVGIVAVQADQLVLVGLLFTDDMNLYVHDVTVRADPDGHTYAYVAAWNQGVWVFDVTVPAAPVFVGKWTDPAAPRIHTVMVTHLEGRRVVVAGPEFANTLHVLDATELGDIRKVGQWRFPDAKPEGSLTWSSHDFNLRDGKLYLAHYHGGVVVLGLASLADAASMPLLGYINPTGAKFTGSSAPSTWDAVPTESGHILAGDMTLGLVVLRMA